MTILGIPYKTFKEQVRIVNAYIGNGRVQVLKEIVYVEIEGR